MHIHLCTLIITLYLQIQNLWMNRMSATRALCSMELWIWHECHKCLLEKFVQSRRLTLSASMRYFVLFYIHFWRLNVTTGVTNLSWSDECKKRQVIFKQSFLHTESRRVRYYQHFADVCSTPKWNSIYTRPSVAFFKFFFFSRSLFWPFSFNQE